MPLVLGMMTGSLFAAPERTGAGAPIEITADGDNRFEEGIAYASGNVVVRYGTDVMYADSIAYNPKTKDSFAVGSVRIYSGTSIYRGDKLGYNFETKVLRSEGFRLLDFPLMAGGDKVTTPGPNHYRISNGYFTTDNREHPSYRLQANTIEIYPDDRVIMKNMLVYLGDVPVLWIPIYSQSLTDERSNFAFSGGSNSRFGPFLLTTYSWSQSQRLRGTAHFDFRTKRGFAGGLDLEYKPSPLTNPSNYANFRGYFADDWKPNDNRTGLPRTRTDDERYLFEYKMLYDFAYDLSVRSDINILSDEYIKEDFYPEEVKVERQPDNMVEIVQYNPTFTASVLLRQQFNTFYETSERSPEVKIETKRQKMFGTPIAYEGESSVVNFSREFTNAERFRASLDGFRLEDYKGYRFDSFHQFLYPKQYFNWLNVTPRVGFRGTYYQNQYFEDFTDNKFDVARLAANAGLEASFKLSRTYDDVQNKAWGIYGLRHTIEPYVNAQVTRTTAPINENGNLFGVNGKGQIFNPRYNNLSFDSLKANTRAPMINYPAFNSIDSIENQAIIRPGIRNKVQTKRDGRNYDILDWAVYFDVDLEKQFYANEIGNVYSELEYRPLPWAGVKSFTTFNPLGDSYYESNNSVLWQVSKAFEVNFGYRWLQSFDSYFVDVPDSNLVFLSTFYRMNEDWQFETLHNFEANGMFLQEQQYRIYRDLSAWQLAVTLADRNNRHGDHELVGYFTLTLKAFPKQEISLNPSK